MIPKIIRRCDSKIRESRRSIPDQKMEGPRPGQETEFQGLWIEIGDGDSPTMIQSVFSLFLSQETRYSVGNGIWIIFIMLQECEKCVKERKVLKSKTRKTGTISRLPWVGFFPNNFLPCYFLFHCNSLRKQIAISNQQLQIAMRKCCLVGIKRARKKNQQLIL